MSNTKVIGSEKKQGRNGDKPIQNQYDMRTLFQKQHNQVDISSPVMNKLDLPESNREKGRQDRYVYNPLNDQNMKVFFSHPRTRFLLMDHNILPPNIEYLQRRKSPQDQSQMLNRSMNNAIEKEFTIRQQFPPLNNQNRNQTERDKSSPKKEEHLHNKSMHKAEIVSNIYSTSNKVSKVQDLISPINQKKLQLSQNSASKRTKTNPNSYRSNNQGFTERETIQHLPIINNKGRQESNTDCIGRQTFFDFMKAQKAKYQLTKTNNNHINEDQIQ